MSSILTNNAAMTALQSLRDINRSMARNQSAITTGKDVANSKDNAAIWAISKVMDSDVGAFRAVSDSLGLGDATVSVSRQAAETAVDLLTEIKQKVVASQAPNVDRSKLQSDIEALREQIDTVANAAQFNGLNLLKDDSYDTDDGTVSVLSSLDRSNGTVTWNAIEMPRRDLRVTPPVWNTTNVTIASVATPAAVGAGTQGTFYTLASGAPAPGDLFRIEQLAGQTLEVPVTLSVHAADTPREVAERLAMALNFAADSMGHDYGFAYAETPAGDFDIIVSTPDDATSPSATPTFAAADLRSLTDNAPEDPAQIGGGLSLLGYFDVNTSEGAEAALGAVEGLIQRAIGAAADLGSVQSQIQMQDDFIAKLIDAVRSGIGTLVDANIEQEAARQQALQVQQQLGTQALSIANQAPQQLLSLFQQ